MFVCFPLISDMGNDNRDIFRFIFFNKFFLGYLSIVYSGYSIKIRIYPIIVAVKLPLLPIKQIDF